MSTVTKKQKITKKETAITVDLEKHLPVLLIKLSSKIALHAMRVRGRKMGLDLREWRIIQALGTYGPCTINEVAAWVALDQGGTSRAIARLEERQLLEREGDANDRRRVFVRLTDKGSKLNEEIATFALAREKRLLRDLSTTESQELNRLLNILIKEADEMLNCNWTPP